MNCFSCGNIRNNNNNYYYYIPGMIYGYYPVQGYHYSTAVSQTRLIVNLRNYLVWRKGSFVFSAADIPYFPRLFAGQITCRGVDPTGDICKPPDLSRPEP